MPNAGAEVITVNECLNTVECRVFKTDSGIPAALYGAESEKIFLCVHGQFGNKFEAESFARIAVPLGWQVLASIFRSTVSAQATPLPALTHEIPCRSCMELFLH